MCQFLLRNLFYSQELLDPAGGWLDGKGALHLEADVEVDTTNRSLLYICFFFDTTLY